MPLLPKILPRAELHKQRAVVPPIAAELQKSLDRLFIKILSDATLDFVKRIKRWWKDFAKTQPEGTVPEEINRNAKMPPLPVFLAFVQHQALSTRGRITEYAVKDTIKSQFHSLFAIWRREALQPLSAVYRQQIFAYIDSEELHAIAPLCTDARPKFTLTAVDFEILVRAFFLDTGFRTVHMSVQMAYIISIQSLMTERPGALVEGSNYRKTNRALLWNEHEWHVEPNPEDPHHPIVFIRVLIHRLKGFSGNGAAHKEFILYPEPNNNRGLCPVAMATALALEDGIFTQITTAEQIFNPAIPPTDHHILSLRPSDQCAVRSDVLTEGKWETSPTRALTYDVYNDFLRRTSLNQGFVNPVTGYCARRGASNRLSGELSEQDLRTLMGHSKKSEAFDSAYKSRLILKDLGAVLHDRPANEQQLTAGEAAANMSSRRDVNAPQKLSLEAQAQLSAEEDLVAMRNARKEFTEQIAALSKTLKSADEDEAVQNLVTSQISDLKARIQSHDKEYRSIVRRETKFRVAQARKDYIAGASERQLLGTDPANKKGEQPTKGKENRPPSGAPLPPASPLDTFIATFFDAAVAFETVNDSIIAYINALHALPRKNLAICYPNEAPDDDGKCAICGAVCTSTLMPKGIGKHIHNCLAARRLADAQQTAAENFEPTICDWDGCPPRLYESRPEFIKHLQNHLMSSKKTLLDGKKRFCKWKEDDDICGQEAEHDWLIGDWASHFASAHGINAHTTIAVDHCSICGEWFEDDLGDGASWASHCVGHYEDMFASHQKRHDGVVNVEPTGIADIGGAIKYDPADGFNGAPLHGHIRKGIALQPYYCPFCVFDESLAPARRMKQFPFATTFQRHLARQHLDDVPTMCPVPSCGTHTFPPLELATHLVRVHRLPVVGTLQSNDTNVLKLPVPDNDKPEVPSKRKSDNNKPGPSKRPQLDADDEHPGITPSVKKYYCTGCRTPLKDIKNHFIRSSLGSLCRKRHRFFQLADNGAKIGEAFSFNLPEDTSLAGSASKNDRHHYCPICDELFKDIRTHLPDHCSSKTFRIKDPKNPEHRRARNGVSYTFADWVLTAP